MQYHNSSTATIQPLIQLPSSLLDAFIPGYGTISTVLSEACGFDVTVIVSISFLVFALIKSFDYLSGQLLRTVTRFGACSVSLDSGSDAYFWVTEWLADKGVGKAYPDLRAVSNARSQDWQSDVGFELNGAEHFSAPKAKE